jgi:(p)ppGpp synthase/HD superfamily hydrolase
MTIPDNAVMLDGKIRFETLGALETFLDLMQRTPSAEADGISEMDHGLQCAAELRVLAPGDEELQVAGLLHDTVEDTEATHADLVAAFGEEVAGIVAEATDDKSLPKEMRKALQVSQAPKKSAAAKMVKLADKISNLRAIVVAPPAGWNHARRVEYVGWAGRVAAGLRGVNPALEALFDKTYQQAMMELAQAAA